MPIELKQNEEVLATDQVLHYSSSFLPTMQTAGSQISV